MLTYKTEQCPRCHGKGTVRFLHLFDRDCPECNGTGHIRVPQITQEKETRPFSVSALNPETLAILQAKPLLLHCLSPSNRADLMRKHSELRLLPPTTSGRLVKSETEQQRRNEAMMHAEENRRQFAKYVQQQYDNSLRRIQEQNTVRFMEWSHKQQQQAQQWANQQFQNFVQQHRGY